MSIKELEQLKELLKKFLKSDGDLPDERVTKTLGLVSETIADSQ